jgi:hypothetical protein
MGVNIPYTGSSASFSCCTFILEKTKTKTKKSRRQLFLSTSHASGFQNLGENKP